MKSLTRLAPLLIFFLVAPLLCGFGDVIKIPDLTDIEDHWAETYINECVIRGIVDGYPDGTFRPSKSITRAEFIKIIVVSFGIERHNTPVFSDVDGHWAEEYINSAYIAGIVLGSDLSEFNPNSIISRQDMALIITRLEKAIGKVLPELRPYSPFVDEEYIRKDCREAVMHLQMANILDGKTGNMFDPFGGMTRAEAAKVICLILENE